MSDSFDAQLDRRLREVPLPPGLLARLQEIGQHEPSASEAELAIASDDAIDQQLCALEPPAGLIDRVQANLAATIADDALDADLRQVTVPNTLLRRLRTIPWETQRVAWGRWATAALWFLMVGGAYFGGVAGWLALSRPNEPAALAWLEVDATPWQTVLPPDNLAEIQLVSSPLASDEVFVDDLAAPAARLDFPPVNSLPRPGVAGELAAQLAGGWQPWQDLLVLRWGVLGSPSDVSDRLPPLEAVVTEPTPGLRPPLVRGFDRQFLLSQGAQPIVSPDAHQELKTLRIPLTKQRDSFDLAWNRLQDARWPESAEVRVADFLAAMQCPLPETSPGQLGVIAAAGPSPFGNNLGDAAAQLLQVSVQAGPIASTQRAPMHLTLALDISASMNQQGRLTAARLAMAKLLDYLGPQDRLSLLLFSDKNQYEVLSAHGDDLVSVRRVLETLQGSGGTDLAAAVQRAASLAMSETDIANLPRQLVLLTDGRAQLSTDTLQRLTALLQHMHVEGLAWSVIDFSDEATPDAQLQHLADNAGGKLHHTRAATDCEWLLVEKLLGRSTVVAPDTTLQLVFDPRAVAAYRLIGHEPTRLAGLEPEFVSIDLRAGQSASGLCEVWLKPNAHDDVAKAVVSWLDPVTAQPQRLEQRISRLQFAPSFSEASLSLQAAAVAAETGEILKESPFASNRQRGLLDVRELAMRVNPRLADQPEFQRYVQFIDAALRVRGLR